MVLDVLDWLGQFHIHAHTFTLVLIMNACGRYYPKFSNERTDSDGCHFGPKSQSKLQNPSKYHFSPLILPLPTLTPTPKKKYLNHS